ncbi:MAG: glycosyltransferase [Dokdonella sp.]
MPVYQGERTLPTLLVEIKPFSHVQLTAGGIAYVVSEVLLVHDCGPDNSVAKIEELAEKYSFVRPVWLSKNYGQHAATLAGMASATGDWVLTIDEDGQHNPADLPKMLDAAIADRLQLLYGHAKNSPPHGPVRNAASRAAKYIGSKLLGSDNFSRVSSFRLVDGEIARTLAAYCGNGVYLDVGLNWVAGRIGHIPLVLRAEGDRPSGYSYVKLLGHFWRLVFTSGTRPLRLITLFGFLSVAIAFAIAAYALWGRLTSSIPVQGWASTVIIVAFFSGCILTALGIIAEYMAVTLGIAMGKPLYVVASKPTQTGSIR